MTRITRNTAGSLTLAACAGIAALALATTTAAAGERSLDRHVRVAVDLNDLETPAGIDQLHRRLTRAAERACQSGSVYAIRSNRRCVRAALDRAIDQADLAPLSVLHANLTDLERYRVARAAPDAALQRLVAEATGGGSAGTIAQPGDERPQR